MSTDGLSRSPDDILSDIRISRDEITCAFTATEIRATDRKWGTALDLIGPQFLPSACQSLTAPEATIRTDLELIAALADLYLLAGCDSVGRRSATAQQ
jgi:hypothetical protein